MRHPRLTLAAACALATIHPGSNAESYSMTSATAGYTNRAEADPSYGTGTADRTLASLRLTHYGVNPIGDHFFLIDDFSGRQIGGAGAGSFGSDAARPLSLFWNARLSASKISGRSVAAGPLEDVFLMYRREASSYGNYKADMLGPSVNLQVPGAIAFQTSLLVSRQRFTGATDADRRLHPFWHLFAVFPFELGPLKGEFAPVVLVSFGKGSAGRDTYIEPDLWLRTPLTGLDVGLRLQYHSYRHYERTSPTATLRWTF